MTPAAPTPPEIFDRNRRRLRRDRMARMDRGQDFLSPLVAEHLLERFEDVKREIADVLLIGGHVPGLAAKLETRRLTVTLIDPGAVFAHLQSGQQCDEDRLLLDTGLAPASFDMVIWAGGLESLNDVPGALIQCRKLLRADGILLGALMGAGSLATLKASFGVVASQQGIARFHPQIDVRAMGDLLQRCGFVLPMADAEILTVRYSGLSGLIADLRASGLTNLLSGPVHLLTRAAREELVHAFAAHRDVDQRISETFALLFFTGWAPPAAP